MKRQNRVNHERFCQDRGSRRACVRARALGWNEFPIALPWNCPCTLRSDLATLLSLELSGFLETVVDFLATGSPGM